jgi:hypothetical protein
MGFLISRLVISLSKKQNNSYLILNGNQCDDIFKYIFYEQPPQIYKKNHAKVRVETSPIFKDRYFSLYNDWIIQFMVFPEYSGFLHNKTDHLDITEIL